MIWQHKKMTNYAPSCSYIAAVLVGHTFVSNVLFQFAKLSWIAARDIYNLLQASWACDCLNRCRQQPMPDQSHGNYRTRRKKSEDICWHILEHEEKPCSESIISLMPTLHNITEQKRYISISIPSFKSKLCVTSWIGWLHMVYFLSHLRWQLIGLVRDGTPSGLLYPSKLCLISSGWLSSGWAWAARTCSWGGSRGSSSSSSSSSWSPPEGLACAHLGWKGGIILEANQIIKMEVWGRNVIV